MNTDMIREALDRQADRVPETQRVRRVLAARAAQYARRRRRRQVIAAAMVTAAVPLLWGLVRYQPAGRATSAATTVAVPQRTIPLRYRPAWLPPGVHEATDAMTIAPGASGLSVKRSYTRGTDDPDYVGVPSMTISVFVGDDRLLGVRQQGVSPEPISVNGIPGTYQKGPDDQVMTWLPDSSVTIMLREAGLGLDRTTLLRIARSVMPDAGSRVMPLAVGWWPGHLAEGRAVVSASGQPGVAKIEAGTVSVTVGSDVDRHVPGGGQPLTVGGHPARWVTVAQGDLPLTYLVVVLRPRHLLVVAVNNGFGESTVIGQRDSIRIAESVVIDETWPDWTTNG
ncbi:MAG: hypothetical protein QG622_850 [Actinomycetota bacterium]|nr:hypothetical protein [Actinomycetota bacterium]